MILLFLNQQKNLKKKKKKKPKFAAQSGDQKFGQASTAPHPN
jgi:hypothetical protein